MKHFPYLLTYALFQSFNLFAGEVSIGVMPVTSTEHPTFTICAGANPVCTSVGVIEFARTVGGNITGTDTIHYGSATNLELDDFNGTIQHWERKLETASWKKINNILASLSEIPANVGTWRYRAMITNESGASDYSSEFILNVTPRNLTITARDISKVYGANYTFKQTSPGDFTVEGLIGTDSVVGVTLTSIGSLNFAPLSGSPYNILPGNATGIGLNNYEILYKTGKLAISKALLVIIADNKSKAYGTVNPTLTFGYYGWANGIETIMTVPSIYTSVSSSSPTGTYEGAITVTGGSAENYAFNYLPGKMTITKASQSITFGKQNDKTYGDSPNDLSSLATASSGLQITYESSNSKVAAMSGSNLTVTGAGTIVITAAQAGDDNYSAAPPVNQTIIIKKAQLSLKATSQSKIYGTINPTLTFSSTGWQNGENAYALTVLPIVTTNINKDSKAGIYAGAITISGGWADNYSFIYSDADFTISKAEQSIAFVQIPVKTFGDASFNVSASVQSGLTVLFSSSNTSVATISGNTINIVGGGTSIITASQSGNNDFTAALAVDQIFTVNPASQVLSVNPLTEGVIALKDIAGTIQVSASSSSGLPVTISLGTGSPGLLNSNNQITNIYQTGKIVILVFQAGNANYNEASISHSFGVAKTNQYLTFNPPGLKTFGDDSFIPTASASSGLPVIFSSSNHSAARVSGFSNRAFHIMPKEIYNYNVYPVPNKGEFTIAIATQEKQFFSVSIYNPIGQKICEISDLEVYGEYKKQIKLKTIVSGTYLIAFSSKDGREIRRMTVLP